MKFDKMNGTYSIFKYIKGPNDCVVTITSRQRLTVKGVIGK